MTLLVRAVIGGILAAVSLGGGAAPTPSQAPPLAVAKLLGQRIMVGLPGTAPSRSLLGAVRAGRVGSVILFSYNISDSHQLASLTGALQKAARQGGNPPLLIATDQEGGQVKRLPSGPPFLSPPQLGERGSAALASGEGMLTGRYLRARGIDMDLAPVLDVPTGSDAFIWQQGRAFSFSPHTVATMGTAFALGLQSAGVAATGKHFPGLGSALADTDNRRQELRPTSRERADALLPYERAIGRGLDAVMISMAGFPGYDRSGASAALSAPIIRGLLRRRLGFRGVAITDSLAAPSGHDEISAGVLAAVAGADILLYSDSVPGELAALERALSSGRISRSAATAAYDRIVALKRALAAPGR